MMKDTSLLWLFTGLLFIAISIPLIREQVSPNRWYGFRVAKTFSNERIWYAANRVAGYDFLWAGIAIALTAGITGLLINQIGSTAASIINFSVLVGALLLALVHSFWNLNRL